MNSRFDQIKLGAEENNAFMKFQRRNKEDVSDIEGAQPRYLPRARSQLNQYLISNDNQEDSLEKIVK